MKKNYTVTEATRDVLGSMQSGRKYTGRELHNMILYRLRVNGSNADPYDSSTLRMVRKYADLYGVVCHKAGKRSKYVKEVLF